jgi:hypothetical protein
LKTFENIIKIKPCAASTFRKRLNHGSYPHPQRRLKERRGRLREDERALEGRSKRQLKEEVGHLKEPSAVEGTTAKS